MGILELIGAGIAGILSGGATGLLGVGIQRVADYFNKKQDLEKLTKQYDHEVRMREADAAIMAQEWAARTRVAEIQEQGKEAVADAGAFAASFGMEPARYSEGVKPGKVAGGLLILLDILRGIVRPGLTIYLCWIASKMYEESRAVLAILDPATHSDTMVKVYAQIVFTLLYLFTTCVLWWFGTRNKQAPPKVAG